MATQFNFRCTEQTAGELTILKVTPESRPTQLEVVCVSGDDIQIEGEEGEILGIETSPISLSAGQGFDFNEASYNLITIIIPAGTTYRLISNQ
jgi:hypothetical protein